MIKCRACGQENCRDTRYCQKCGGELPAKFTYKLGFLAGNGLKEASVAPIMTSDFCSPTVRARRKVPVFPLEDGSWFCPDCGDKNLKAAVFCRGCGREL